MKKSHKLILALLFIYFVLAQVTSQLEVNTLRDRTDRLEMLLLQQGRQQEQILNNQEKFMSSNQQGPQLRGLPLVGPPARRLPDRV